MSGNDINMKDFITFSDLYIFKMHYLLIAINNSSNANGKSRKDNGYLCLILHFRNLCLNEF